MKGSAAAAPRTTMGAAGTAASPGERRAWIAGHLDPLEVDARPATEVRSDFDLDPGHIARPSEPLIPAAVLIGLVEHPAGMSVILTRRADTLRSHTGQVALPGGALRFR